MKLHKRILTLVFIMIPWSLYGSQQVIIIGGGPTPKESQVSIQLNTQWIVDIINQHDPKLISHLFFTDGNQAGVDVNKRKITGNEYEILKPLAAVYNMDAENGEQYYSSMVASNVESADERNVTNKLQYVFSHLRKGDELLLIFQGHGGYKRTDTSGNYLRLWNDTRMTVTQLEALMSEADPESTIRFVLPQCFSGGFSKLIYKNAHVENGIAKGNRCGFLAQNEHQGSEGCTPSVNTDTYRDYSSYLFSAIAGKTISGNNINDNPDANNDGIVTLKEAHIYTLMNAFSVDYSRSTSDDYLEHWQPWYLKWMPDISEPENIYSEIYSGIAKRFNLEVDAEHLVSVVADRLKMFEKKNSDNKLMKKKLINEIQESQKNIQAELATNWPQLQKPYTAQFREILINEITEINDFIIKQDDYSGLVDNLQKLNSLDSELLDIRRNIIQMLKILRMRNMARLLNQFETYADNNEKAEYEKLLRCEDTRLFH